MLFRRALAHVRLEAAACAALLLPSSDAAAQHPTIAQYPPGQYGSSPYQPPGQYRPPPTVQPIPHPGAPGYTPLPPSTTGHDLLSDRTHSWPTLRAAPGAAATLVEGTSIRPSFILDLITGFRFAATPWLYLTLEGGYTFDSEPDFGGHFAAIGLGPELYTGRYIGIGVIPKFVIGETWDGFALGVRNTLVVPFLMRAFSLEVGHQYLRAEGRDQHEIRVQISHDIAAMVHLYAWLVIGKGR